MKDFSGFRDGDITTALVCFTDIAGFTRTARSLPIKQSTALLKRISSIISKHVDETSGKVVKYIGDSSLLVFPEEGIDETMRELLSMKREIDQYFESDYPDLSICFSANVGEIMIVQLDPFDDLDILGDTVGRTSLLEKLIRGGGFVISQEVYQRLSTATQRQFHKVDTPVAYTAESTSE